MDTIKRLCAGFAAALMIGTLGCAATGTQQSTGAYLDDTAITTKVKSAILNEPSLSVGDIGVETNDGVVRLSGAVGNRTDMNKAVAIARSVSGVSSVRNDLQLK